MEGRGYDVRRKGLGWSSQGCRTGLGRVCCQLVRGGCLGTFKCELIAGPKHMSSRIYVGTMSWQQLPLLLLLLLLVGQQQQQSCCCHYVRHGIFMTFLPPLFLPSLHRSANAQAEEAGNIKRDGGEQRRRQVRCGWCCRWLWCRWCGRG